MIFCYKKGKMVKIRRNSNHLALSFLAVCVVSTVSISCAVLLLHPSNSSTTPRHAVGLETSLEMSLASDNIQYPRHTSRIPDYDVTTTNFGWTTPNDLKFPRKLISQEFFEAVQAHPKYNRTAWSDLEDNPDPTRIIVAFLDVDTCDETNYPIYNNIDWRINSDTKHGRFVGKQISNIKLACKYIKRAMESKALSANPHNRLILLDCSGMVHRSGLSKKVCRKMFRTKTFSTSNQTLIAYRSISFRHVREGLDMGLPPPAIKPVTLSKSDRDSIRSCNATRTRKWLFSFQGRSGFGREKLLQLHDGKRVFVRLASSVPEYSKEIFAGQSVDSWKYKDALMESVFVGAPKGDTFFSYRFAEILSAGSIPVVFSDEWLRPFRKEVVDWEKSAVFIPENKMNKTLEILEKISIEERCRMQQAALHNWDEYISSRVGWVKGLVESAVVANTLI
jgi:hypothetical protein